MNVEFDELINYNDRGDIRKNVVICGFKTRRFGTLQVGRAGEIVEYPSEPNLHNFTPEERAYIDEITLIVHRLVFDHNL